MSLKKEDIERIQGLCKTLILAEANRTVHCNSKAIYCSLRNPIMISGQYTDGAFCRGAIIIPLENGRYKMGIQEQRIIDCPERKY
jgi:hypothetical protein